MSSSQSAETVLREQPPPFSINLLQPYGSELQKYDLTEDQLVQLLPASYSTDGVNLRAPKPDPSDCIRKELSVSRLNDLDDYLWLAGQLRLPRPLHQQLLVRRKLCITEDIDMHLLWTSGKLFIKPCPAYLLDPQFWTRYLRCGSENGCNVEKSGCSVHSDLWQSALGFLFSYTALVRHPSDFRIAKENYLLPKEVEWLSWVTFVQQLNTDGIHKHINPRFCHGELRLNRLNKLHQLFRDPMKGYSTRWDEYSAFFKDNFAWMAGATVYIAIVLTALQVGQATDKLGGNHAFRQATYGFTIFAILGPLIGGVLALLLFCSGIVYNWINTVSRRRKRLQETKCGHSHGTGQKNKTV